MLDKEYPPRAVPSKFYLNVTGNEDFSVMIFSDVADNKVVDDRMLREGLPDNEQISSEGNQGQFLTRSPRHVVENLST